MPISSACSRQGEVTSTVMVRCGKLLLNIYPILLRHFWFSLQVKFERHRVLTTFQYPDGSESIENFAWCRVKVCWITSSYPVLVFLLRLKEYHMLEISTCYQWQSLLLHGNAIVFRSSSHLDRSPEKWQIQVVSLSLLRWYNG